MFILVLFLGITSLKAQKIELLQQGTRTSIRGLSVVDNKVAWVSGSRGNVALSADGGKTWKWQQVKGYEQSDFRDIEAFSGKEAIIMSSGTPAVILKTIDGGETWQLKYKNEDKAYFLDAMDFDGKKHGFILGDPINNKFLLLETNDAGETWHPFSNPPDAMPSEAAFAASGTCLRVDKKGGLNIVTGGKVARWLSYYPDSKNNKSSGWNAEELPIASGKESQGAFSIAVVVGWVFVGGDYSNPKNTNQTVSVANLNGDIHGPFINSEIPSGYQSCIEYLSGKEYHSLTLISTGTSGTNLSLDGGQLWRQIDATSFNVCRKAKKGSLFLLAGDGGKIAVFKP